MSNTKSLKNKTLDRASGRFGCLHAGTRSLERLPTDKHQENDMPRA